MHPLFLSFDQFELFSSTILPPSAPLQLFLWCNNREAWWPDIPVAIAIIVTTFIMITICSHVYKVSLAFCCCHNSACLILIFLFLKWRQTKTQTEMATQRYARGRLTTFPAVFWQSMWCALVDFMYSLISLTGIRLI